MLKLFVIFDQYPNERRPVVPQLVPQGKPFRMTEPGDPLAKLTQLDANQVGLAIDYFHKMKPFAFRFEVDPA
jgi:hypothetical protein